MFRCTAQARAFLRAGFIAAAAAAVLAPTARANEVPLTLAEAQRRAVVRSQTVIAQDSAVAASRDMAAAAGQLPDPVLKFGVDNLPVDGQDAWSLTRDFMTMRRIGLMQEWTRESKRELRAGRYDLEAEKGLIEKSGIIAAILRDTALAWLDRNFAEAMAGVVSRQIAEARLEVEAAEGAYRAGRGNQADIFAAKSARFALEDRASEIDRRVRTATAALARWVGPAAEGVLAGLPALDAIPHYAHSFDEELARHPQIAALGKQQEIAAAEAKIARTNSEPDWSVEVAYQQRGSAYSNMISVGVSIPLPWDQRNRQDRDVASRLAQVDQARALREDALRTHVTEVRTMIIEWGNGRDRLARYERELVPLAGERTAAALAAYRGGRSGLADVLAARRNEIDVRLQVLQLEQDTARLWAQLNFMTVDGTANALLDPTAAPAAMLARGAR